MPKYTDEEVPQFPLLPSGTIQFKIDLDGGLAHVETKKGIPRAAIVLMARAVAPSQAANLRARNMFVLGNDRDPKGVLPETKSSSPAWRRWRELRAACDIPSLGSTEEEAVAMAGKEFGSDISIRAYWTDENGNTAKPGTFDANDTRFTIHKVNDFGRFYKVGTFTPRIFDAPTVGAPSAAVQPVGSPEFARRAAMSEDE